MGRTGIGNGNGPTALDAIASGTPVVPGPVNPGNEEVRAFESCANTFDPNVAPGLDRPIGSRLIRRNGLAAWDKIGPLATDWSPVGSGSSGGSFVPSDISGLVLDLNPAEGVTVNGSDEVQAITDQGTGGNDLILDSTTAHGAPFILTPAAIGGLPGLVSDPILGSSLVSANAAPVFAPGSARTVFVVANVLQADDGCVFLAFQPSGGISTTFALGLWNFSNAGTLYPYTDGITISEATGQGPGAFENETKIYAFRFSGSGQIEMSVNGAPFGALSPPVFASETGSNGYHVGRFIGTSFQGCFKGTLGRMLGYNSALTDDDAARVMTYLLDGYGIEGTILSTDIADSTPDGRTVLTSTLAQQQAFLGIANVGDLRNFAVTDAISLLGLTRPQVVVDEPFNCTPGASNSVFNAVGGTLARSSIGEGGWFSLTTAAGAGGNAATHNNERNQIVTNPAGKKWYVLILFAVSSAVNADSVLRLGLYDRSLGSDNGVFLGIHGATDPTKFGFFQQVGAVVSGVLSSLAVDLNAIHLGRLWSDAAGGFFGSMDFESAKTFAGTVANACMAHLQMLNGAGGGARAFSFGHVLVITE